MGVEERQGEGVRLRILTGANEGLLGILAARASSRWHRFAEGEDAFGLISGFTYNKGCIVEAGWPYLSMNGRLWALDVGTGLAHVFALYMERGDQTVADGVIDLAGPPLQERHVRLLPLRPRWGGFIFNTVFYAMLLAFPLNSFLLVRRWSRRWRGCRPVCAYLLGQVRGLPGMRQG